MLTFAMDCWLLGLAYALLDIPRLMGDVLGTAWSTFKSIVLKMSLVGLVIFAFSNWMFSFFVLWSMWE